MRFKSFQVSHMVSIYYLPTTQCAVAHVSAGFAVVGEYEDVKIRDAQKAAFEQMLSWLKSH